MRTWKVFHTTSYENSPCVFIQPRMKKPGKFFIQPRIKSSSCLLQKHRKLFIRPRMKSSPCLLQKHEKLFMRPRMKTLGEFFIQGRIKERTSHNLVCAWPINRNEKNPSQMEKRDLLSQTQVIHNRFVQNGQSVLVEILENRHVLVW